MESIVFRKKSLEAYIKEHQGKDINLDEIVNVINKWNSDDNNDPMPVRKEDLWPYMEVKEIEVE